MSVGLPWGFLALAAALPIVAAYFLRRRQRPRVVSALFLWRTPSQRAQAGPRWERFSREASLALELLAVACAALFLADVRCGAQVQQRHVVAVVDGSLSMAATVNGTPLSDAVKARVAALARSQGATQLTVVESGPRPTVVAGPQAEVGRALAQLEAWSPLQPAHDVAPALLMARELAGARQRVWLFTDGPLPPRVGVPPEVQVESVGQKLPNLAFVSAQRRDVGKTAQVTVRVLNASDAAREVPVRFAAPGLPPQTQTVSLRAGATAVVRVGLSAAEGATVGPVEAALPEDALPADSALTLLPSPDPVVNVAVLEGLSPPAFAALKRFLAVAPGVRVQSPASLSFGPPASTARVRLGAGEPLKGYVGPFFQSKAHPLLDDVDLSGVVWAAGPNPPGRPLATAGDAVLVSEEDDGTVHLNLDVGHSAVARTGAWPVLLGNVLRRARFEAPGLPRRHLMLGEDVPVTTTAGATWRLEGPQGRKRPILAVGTLTLPPLEVPGRWRLLKDGEEVDALAVLPIDPRESDLRDRGPYEVKAQAEERVAGLFGERPRPWWPLLALLVLLALDFWVTAREARA